MVSMFYAGNVQHLPIMLAPCRSKWLFRGLRGYRGRSLDQVAIKLLRDLKVPNPASLDDVNYGDVEFDYDPTTYGDDEYYGDIDDGGMLYGVTEEEEVGTKGRPKTALCVFLPAKK